jgi:hypothetical protein
MQECRIPISASIQRQVRQRCGFGCVICGIPIYEYHHIEPYSKKQEHDPNNLTLLCDMHHKEATNGLLTKDQIIEGNAKPYNVQHNISSPYGLHFGGTQVCVNIGGNEFSTILKNDSPTMMIPVSIDDIDIISFQIDNEGNLFLNTIIFDENNMPLLWINNNFISYRVTAWDIEFKGTTLTVREASRRIFFEIDFNPPSRITITRARLLCNGIEILVRESHIFVVNCENILCGNKSFDCKIGLQLGRNCRGYGGGFSAPPDALSRYFLPRSEVERREKEAITRMNRCSDETIFPKPPTSGI